MNGKGSLAHGNAALGASGALFSRFRGGFLRSSAPEAAETAGCAGFRPVGVGTALVDWIFREQASGGMCRPDRPQARIRDTRSLKKERTREV